jgi:hypothetical protein
VETCPQATSPVIAASSAVSSIDTYLAMIGGFFSGGAMGGAAFIDSAIPFVGA